MALRTSRQRRGRLVLVVGLAITVGLLAAPPPSARAAGQGDWASLVALFELRGLKVVGDSPRCRERDLFGLYERSQRRIIVCPRGNQRETLLHEGWHGVQALCLRGKPLLPKEVLDRGLTARDRRDLDRLYGPRGWNHEAEARVMASLPLQAYRTWLDAACGPLEEPQTPPAAADQPPRGSPAAAGGGSAPGGGI